MATDTNGEVVWRRNENASDHEEVWDDTVLIEAYDKAVNQMKEEIARRTSPNGTGKKKGKNKKTKSLQGTTSWKVGDYCQAAFSEDGLPYEAYVKEINQSGDSCVVQYIGYGNEEIVPLVELASSLGKEARTQQEAAAGVFKQPKPKKESGSETSSQRSFSQGKRRPKNQKPWGGATQAPPANKNLLNSIPGPPGGTASWFLPGASSQHCCPSSSQAPACPYAGNSHMHQRSPIQPQIPPPPPFPMDSGPIQSDEALAAMLMSWYMSGYHTGYYQAIQQNKSPKPPGPCCMHSSR